MTESADAIARRLAAIVESSDDAIVSKDLNGIVLSWNQAAERMFGYTADEMIGTSIRRIIPDDRQSEEDTVLASIRAGRRVDHFETVRQRTRRPARAHLAERLTHSRRRPEWSSGRRRSRGIFPIANARSNSWRERRSATRSSPKRR